MNDITDLTLDPSQWSLTFEVRKSGTIGDLAHQAQSVAMEPEL